MTQLDRLVATLHAQRRREPIDHRDQVDASMRDWLGRQCGEVDDRFLVGMIAGLSLAHGEVTGGCCRGHTALAVRSHELAIAGLMREGVR